ncbi:MAG TPA: FAD-dependent oxidoreductase, partial [Anaerolineae bacterium]|nr:FAD-dependent oxidoreductase [Anaerolineae bacterium]
MSEVIVLGELKIKIDGRSFVAQPGQTILEVARANGVNIPHLCNDPRLKPGGTCGMCLVELAGAGESVKACSTPVADGMVVYTRTQDLVDRRRKRLDEIFADHWADCIAPCRLACPAGTDAQGYIGLIAQKRYRDAVELIKQTNPLPGVIGRVCTRPCEDACRRNLVDEQVSICFLKRFVADRDKFSGDRFKPVIKPATGKKVAIVGAGPAGLSAAYYLAIEGHKPVIFDAMPKAGGMLRYGIPAYRLPKDILDDEIDEILELGVELRTNRRLGKDFTIEELQRDYDAVFLGIGAQRGTTMRIENEDVPGVVSGVGFIRSIGLQDPINIGKRIAVVGGGNVAIDAARSALRLGAEKVYLIYRRGRAEMPALDVEVEEAEDEGIEFILLANPVRVIGKDKVEGIECVRMTLGEPDASGRRRPEPQPGSEFTLEVDNVITAIGQAIDGTGAKAVMDGKYMAADPRTMQTAIPGVFAAGDAVTGPGEAIQAVAGGRDAAFAIIQYLKGEAIDLGPTKPFSAVRGGVTAEDLGVQKAKRVPMPILEPSQRLSLGNFNEVELGYSEEEAVREAQRCLECGCTKQNDCDLRDLAIEYDIQPNDDYEAMRHFAIDKSHPVVLRDQNKCIQCQKCVQICDEVVGVKALEYRITQNDIVPTGNVPLAETTCESCGQCISACPTAALVENRPKFAREFLWPPKVTTTTCTYCGVGCQLELNTDHAGRVFRVTEQPGTGVNKGNLCGKGRFGYHFINHQDRLTSPLIRKNGVLVEASWDEAVNLVALKLFEAKNTYGA